MNNAPAGHIFSVRFHIAGATEHGDHSVRAYEDPGLQDQGLSLPIDDDGIFEAEFERTTPTFGEAVLSALADLQRVFPEADLVRVEPDDLVTISGIAERVGRSHESIRLLIDGKRGPGDFPQRAGTLGGKAQVWRWHEVVDWFEQKMKRPVPDSENAAFLAMINDLLRVRLAAPRVIDNRETATAMAALLPQELASAS
jgi:predicted DNA-binding transcriptional regulator AlpA